MRTIVANILRQKSRRRAYRGRNSHTGPDTPHGKCVHKPFNIVEIVLAIGVIGVGIASVMALFPAGSNAMRDAMANGYSANMADQFLHFTENKVRQECWPANNWTFELAGTSGYEIPEKTNLGNKNASFSLTYNAGQQIYPYQGNPGSEPGIFKILQYQDKNNNGQFDPNTDTVDFEAIMALWRSQITGPSGSAINNQVAIALNAEISWPAQRPYDEREKSTYRLELFNRN